MNWPSYRIGEFASVLGGKRLPKGMTVQEAPTPYRYLRVVDMTVDRVDTSTVKYITEEAHARVRRYVVTDRDVFISIAGTIGRVGVVPPEFSGCHLTENAARITGIGNEVDHRYLAYFLRSPLGQAEIASRVVGTSQPKLALFRIADIPVVIPPVDVQRAIAAVLAAYDELIENNLRRIEILEEMAQAVYREWFVSYRYPGHENVPLVQSPVGDVPSTWTVARLGDHAEFAYGKALKADSRNGGAIPVYGSSGVVGWHDEYLVPGPGIVVGRKGNVGSVHWADGDFYPIDTTFYVRSELPLSYLYHNLQSQHFLNSDAAVPGLNRNQAYTNPLVVPPTTTLDLFDDMVQPMVELQRNLDRQNENLRETRDLLLPRLVSGEIDVSDLDINTEWLAS